MFPGSAPTAQTPTLPQAPPPPPLFGQAETATKQQGKQGFQPTFLGGGGQGVKTGQATLLGQTG